MSSLPYHPFLISRLKKSSYAALYLETHFEIDEGEPLIPQMLECALSNVNEALSQGKMTPEQAQAHQQKLEEIFALEGVLVIYYLGEWLKELGLKLTVKVDEVTGSEIVDGETTENITNIAPKAIEKVAVMA